jgi:hypothetical protein
MMSSDCSYVTNLKTRLKRTQSLIRRQSNHLLRIDPPSDPERCTGTPSTETGSSIENECSHIRPWPNPDIDASKYGKLCTRIEDNQSTVVRLRGWNAALKSEAARCEAKIVSYSQMKRKYDLLPESLSQIADSRSRHPE